MSVKKHSFVAVALLVSLVVGGAIAGAVLIARATGTVNVTATVAQSVTCSVGAASTAFGTLTTSAIATASPNVTSTVACNDGLGCTLYVQDAGNGTSTAGLYNSSSSPYLIPSSAATLAAGTEGYGIQGSVTTPATGGALTIGGTYTGTGNTVGALSRTNVALASASTPTTGGVVTVAHLAAISNLTTAGSYADTITYSCTGN